MKQKSMRQLAKELGVSHSYLSQVKHGKRPASAKVVSKMVSTGKHNVGQKSSIPHWIHDSKHMVGDTGLEPVTSAMSTQRSNQLS